MGDMLQQLLGAAKSTDRFIRSSPWQAMGTVALAGLAAGILVSKGAQYRGRRAKTGEATRADAESEVAGG